MEKVEFSPAGLAQLLQALYALPDEALNDEAGDAASDFAGWVAAHFELSTSQQQFLAALAPQFKADSGADTAFALRNRLPIHLVKPDPAGAAPRSDKFVRRKNNSQETSNASGDVQASGDLTYEVID